MSKSSGSDSKSYNKQRHGRYQHQKRRNNFRRGVQNLSLAELQQNFAACGRCGYFLTGYRVIHGVDAVEEAARKTYDGWITLVWDQSTRDLLYRTYGMRTDIASYHYESVCPECQRKIVYAGEMPADFVEGEIAEGVPLKKIAPEQADAEGEAAAEDHEDYKKESVVIAAEKEDAEEAAVEEGKAGAEEEAAESKTGSESDEDRGQPRKSVRRPGATFRMRVG